MWNDSVSEVEENPPDLFDDGVSDEVLIQALTEALTEVGENHPDLFDDGVSDEALLQAGGRFDFDLEPVVDRRSARMGVQERVFRTRVRQRGNLEPGQDIVGALTQGLRASMNRLLEDETIGDRDRVFFTLGSNRLANNYNGWGLRAGEWRRNAFRVESMLQHLARMLNSNEQFEVNDSFQLAFVHVRDGPRGGGRPRRLKPGHRSMVVLREMKRTVVRIPRTRENTCCARAIVTARAKVENHPKWRAFLRGRPIQGLEAERLHELAGVPRGKCGDAELKCFAAHPSMYDYMIVVVDADRCFETFVYGFGHKRLALLHEKGHYDTITSLPGFFGTVYVCAHCFKGYNHQGQHRCLRNENHCGACLQEGCPDHARARSTYGSTTRTCDQCFRSFYGDVCFENHMGRSYDGKPIGPEKPAVCIVRRKCKECLKLLRGGKEIKEHVCGHATCPSCKDYVEIEDHRCFLQVAKRPAELREERKRKRQSRGRVRRGAAAGLRTLRANENSDEEECNGEEDEEEKEPLHVFFDIECRQEGGRHEPNLVGTNFVGKLPNFIAYLPKRL